MSSGEVLVQVGAEFLLLVLLGEVAEHRADGSRCKQWRSEQPDNESEAAADDRAGPGVAVALLEL
jgi:hypothetical protein